MQPRRPTRPRVSSCLFCFRPFPIESSISRSLIRRLQSLTSRAMQSIKAIHTTLSIKSAIRQLIIHHQRRFQTPIPTPHQHTTMSSPPNDPKHQEIYNKLASQDAAPLPLKKVLAKEQADFDCLSCRVMGKIFLLCTSKELSFTDLSWWSRSHGIRHIRSIYILVRSQRIAHQRSGNYEIWI